MNPAESIPQYDAAAECAKGQKNAELVMTQGVDVSLGFVRHKLGPISLIYGDTKAGICHILERRRQEISSNPQLVDQDPKEVVLKLIEVVVYGQGKRAGAKWIFEHEEYRAVVGSPDGNQLTYWLLTGYKIT